jgi:hypothetical protein
VRESRVAARGSCAAASVVSGAALLLATALCSGCATTGTRAVKPDAQLVVDAAVPDARIYVDDVFAGRAAELRGRAILVRSGTRRLEIRADGYFTAYRDVTITRGARAAITVALRAAPANEPAE